MNDRLRYRAWATESGKMYDNAYFDGLEVGIWDDDGEYALIGDMRENSLLQYCILLQCTGLKDKNGTLIYEGDIFVDEIGRKMVVKYEEGMWTEEGYMTGYNFDFSIHDNCVVIGNIYENPEIVVSK